MIEVTTDEATIRRVYDELLSTSFPPSELVSRGELLDSVADGVSEVVVVRDRGGIGGAAVGERYEAATLLAYLAVRDAARGLGAGGLLLDHVTRRWSAAAGNLLVIAEIERPDRHAADPRFGDPQRRLRFYERHGASALALPYFQPSLAPSLPRAYGLLLIVLAASPAALDPSGARLMDVRPVREFLLQTMGAPDDGDAATAAVFAPLDDPEGVPLVPLARYAGIPFSVEPGDAASPGA